MNAEAYKAAVKRLDELYEASATYDPKGSDDQCYTVWANPTCGVHLLAVVRDGDGSEIPPERWASIGLDERTQESLCESMYEGMTRRASQAPQPCRCGDRCVC